MLSCKVESGGVSDLDLYLIRHGTTGSNSSGHLQGQTDVPLSDRGVAEAEATALHLAATLEGPVRIISSPLQRAYVTATHIARQLNSSIETSPEWMEMDVGDLAGGTWANAGEGWPQVIRQWYEDPQKVHFPGARESIAQFTRRVRGAVDTLWNDPSTERVLVVTHGGALNAAVTYLLRIGLSDAFPFHFSNCGISLIRRQGTRMRVHHINQVAHLTHLPPGAAFQAG